MLGHLRRANHRDSSAAGQSALASTPLLIPTRQLVLRGLLLSGLLVLVLAVLTTGIALTYSGIYPGVRVGAVALGGTDQATAIARLQEAGARWEATPLTLVGPGGSATKSWAELGLQYDPTATAAAALAVGHHGTVVERLRALQALIWRDQDVAPVFHLDPARLQAQLAALAAVNDIAPRDGALQIINGQAVVTPAVEGRGLDLTAAVPLVLAAAHPGANDIVVLPVAERLQPKLNTAVLAEAERQAATLLVAPVQLVGADLDVQFSPATIGDWLVVKSAAQGGAAPLMVMPDRAAVRQAVAALAPQVRRDTQNAGYEYDQRQRRFVVTVPALAGRQLDIDATTAALLAALEQPTDRQATAVVTEWRPGLTNEDIATANQQLARSYLAGPLVLRGVGLRWLLTVPELANWVTILPGNAPATIPRVVFDQQALAEYIAGIKGVVDLPAVDAGYTMDDGSDVYRVTSPSAVGRSLDAAAAQQVALAVLQGGGSGRVVDLRVQETQPQLTEAQVAQMVPERWIEANLTTQRMYAVVGKKVVYTAVISSGKAGWETPTGTFHIIYRVENETMTSESIGAEEHYRLENVLYTQYFTNEGHALHYSWWKAPGSFGVPTSHGCLSETLADATFFWNFATIGTRVTIHS